MDMNEITALLEQHPDIRKRVEELLNIMKGGRHDEILLADDAEERVITATRGMGRDVLQNWADDRSKKASVQLERRVGSAKKNVKKKSIG